jgi:uridine kinase
MDREQIGEVGSCRAFVVVVSGTSGGGKTALVDKAATLLQNAIRLYFDDYISVSNNPVDIRGWLETGANPDAFKTPQLVIDLRKLISGEFIGLPNDRGFVAPAAFILVEDPFGRSRTEMAPLIDFAAYLDVPEDVALARRIIRGIEERKLPPEELLAHICLDLKTYLAAGREAYAAAGHAAKNSADLVLDGLRSLDVLASDLVTEIRRRSAQTRRDSGRSSAGLIETNMI